MWVMSDLPITLLMSNSNNVSIKLSKSSSTVRSFPKSVWTFDCEKRDICSHGISSDVEGLFILRFCDSETVDLSVTWIPSSFVDIERREFNLCASLISPTEIDLYETVSVSRKEMVAKADIYILLFHYAVSGERSCGLENLKDQIVLLPMTHPAQQRV